MLRSVLLLQILDVSELKPLTEGFLEVIRLAWVTSRMIAKQATEVTKIGVYIEDDGVLYQCLNRAYDHDVFGFLSTQVFGTAAFQVFFSFLRLQYIGFLAK